jgi:hypothetical protein
MKYDRVVEETVRKAQNVLWANLPPLSDELTVKRIRVLVSVPGVQEALEHCSDTCLPWPFAVCTAFCRIDRSHLARRSVGFATSSTNPISIKPSAPSKTHA